jgi:hypothetical protein
MQELGSEDDDTVIEARDARLLLELAWDKHRRVEVPGVFQVIGTTCISACRR